ncbi:signal peptidase I [Actinomadura logoneensis]|uniref:Signal peptidase I n=1 Tax=Actinomadura logoneensis TaxID=2293572 RepID=A0A372JMA6_9ACTN|nr:signal peptidase I [Actinomadura logoneensis]RFU41142.1 signal peptidase I [Actinomadura logoneensis]
MQPDAEDQHTEPSRDTPDQENEKDEGKRKGSFWKELPILIAVAVILALTIKAFAVQAFYIPSGSMENTLLVGDRVLVNKIVFHTRSVTRGDVIVFKGPPSWQPEVQVAKPGNIFSKAMRWIGTAFGVAPTEKDYIKRVIGIPGDHVKCCDARGRITVNGVALNEQAYIYVDPADHQQDKPSESPFDITLQDGQLWVMGDHRSNSLDSRAHQDGPENGSIPTKDVIGRAFVKVWPLNRVGTIPIPETFKQPALKHSKAFAPLPDPEPGPVPAFAAVMLPLAIGVRFRR